MALHAGYLYIYVPVCEVLTIEEGTEFDLENGHQYGQKADGFQATCEEAGYTAHKQCQREGCGYRNIDYKVIPAKGHEFKAENGYYTDTAIGYHAYKCSNCEAYGVDKVKYSAEYDGLDWIVVGGIKCEFSGEYVNYEANGAHSHKLTCVCGNVSSDVCSDATPEYVEPTCTENGYYVNVCDVCKFEWTVEGTEEADKALGHDLVVKSNGNGTHSAICQRDCGYADVLVYEQNRFRGIFERSSYRKYYREYRINVNR